VRATETSIDTLQREPEQARQQTVGPEPALNDPADEIRSLKAELDRSRRYAQHADKSVEAANADIKTLKAELTQVRRHTVRMEQALVEAQRLATIGQLASQMAHEFKNVLMIIMGRAGYALSENDAELTEKALQTSVDCGQRGADVVKGLLDYANGRQRQSRVIRADELMDRAVDLVAWALPKSHVQLVREYESDACIRVVPVRIEQVLLNLILNARNAMKPRGGRLTAIVRQAGTEGYVTLCLKDTGCGIPNEHLERIFDPFFTTRPRSEDDSGSEWGTGLGLPVARDLVRQAGGEIHVESVPNEGSTFTVLLPVINETP